MSVVGDAVSLRSIRQPWPESECRLKLRFHTAWNSKKFLSDLMDKSTVQTVAMASSASVL